MKPQPYTEDEITTFIMTIHKPYIPYLLKLIVQIPDYADMDIDDQYAFDDELESLGAMFHMESDVILGHKPPVIPEEPVIDLDRFLNTKLSDEFLTSLVLGEWSNVEFHYDFIDLWKSLFSSITITEEDRNVAELPDNFDVYRAGIKEGLSWTLDIEKAKWFHNRNGEKLFDVEEEHNYFLKTNVNKDEILFYTNERSEEEVILIPNQEKIIVL